MLRFVNHIMPNVPQCPPHLIQREVLRAGIQFCRNSYIWRQTDTETVAEGYDEIVLVPPVDAAVTDVSLTVDGIAFSAYRRDGDTLTLDDACSQDTDFEVTLFLQPARDAADLPDLLYDDWFEGVESLAKANLMLMPGKPWTNQQVGVINQQKYLHDVGEAAMQTRRINKQTSLTIRPRRFV